MVWTLVGLFLVITSSGVFSFPKKRSTVALVENVASDDSAKEADVSTGTEHHSYDDKKYRSNRGDIDIGLNYYTLYEVSTLSSPPSYGSRPDGNKPLQETAVLNSSMDETSYTVSGFRITDPNSNLVVILHESTRNTTLSNDEETTLKYPSDSVGASTNKSVSSTDEEHKEYYTPNPDDRIKNFVIGTSFPNSTTQLESADNISTTLSLEPRKYKASSSSANAYNNITARLDKSSFRYAYNNITAHLDMSSFRYGYNNVTDDYSVYPNLGTQNYYEVNSNEEKFNNDITTRSDNITDGYSLFLNLGTQSYYGVNSNEEMAYNNITTVPDYDTQDQNSTLNMGTTNYFDVNTESGLNYNNTSTAHFEKATDNYRSISNTGPTNNDEVNFNSKNIYRNIGNYLNSASNDYRLTFNLGIMNNYEENSKRENAHNNIKTLLNNSKNKHGSILNLGTTNDYEVNSSIGTLSSYISSIDEATTRYTSNRAFRTLNDQTSTAPNHINLSSGTESTISSDDNSSNFEEIFLYSYSNNDERNTFNYPYNSTIPSSKVRVSKNDEITPYVYSSSNEGFTYNPDLGTTDFQRAEDSRAAFNNFSENKRNYASHPEGTKTDNYATMNNSTLKSFEKTMDSINYALDSSQSTTSYGALSEVSTSNTYAFSQDEQNTSSNVLELDEEPRGSLATENYTFISNEVTAERQASLSIQTTTNVLRETTTKDSAEDVATDEDKSSLNKELDESESSNSSSDESDEEIKRWNRNQNVYWLHWRLLHRKNKM